MRRLFRNWRSSGALQRADLRLRSPTETVHHRRVKPVTILAPVVAAFLPVAACTGGDAAQSPRETERERTPDPKHLVVHASDLPTGFSLVPGERIPVPLSSVLADPSSAGASAAIRHERVAGYQISFWTPQRRRVECAAAVYRSSSGAAEVFRQRDKRFRTFVAASLSGRPARVGLIGNETSAYHFEVRGSRGLTVGWRYRNVLSSCTTIGLGAIDVRQMVVVARAQQRRISDAFEDG